MGRLGLEACASFRERRLQLLGPLQRGLLGCEVVFGLDSRTATSNQAPSAPPRSLNTIEVWNGRSWMVLDHR